MQPDKPNFYITAQNFNAMIGNGLWRITEVPPEVLPDIKSFLADEKRPRCSQAASRFPASITWARWADSIG